MYVSVGYVSVCASCVYMSVCLCMCYRSGFTRLTILSLTDETVCTSSAYNNKQPNPNVVCIERREWAEWRKKTNERETRKKWSCRTTTEELNNNQDSFSWSEGKTTRKSIVSMSFNCIILLLLLSFSAVTNFDGKHFCFVRLNWTKLWFVFSGSRRHHYYYYNFHEFCEKKTNIHSSVVINFGLV